MKLKDVPVWSIFKNSNGYVTMMFGKTSTKAKIINLNGSIYKVSLEFDYQTELLDITPEVFLKQFPMNRYHKGEHHYIIYHKLLKEVQKHRSINRRPLLLLI